VEGLPSLAGCKTTLKDNMGT
jgi:hypothetical protein